MNEHGTSISETRPIEQKYSPVPKGRASYSLGGLPHRGGFSLLELVIYMGLLGLVMVALMEIFLGINAGRGKGEAQTEVNSNLRFAFQKIQSDLQAATAVSVPVSTGASSSVLTITTPSSTITYCAASSTLYRSNGVNPAVGSWANTAALPSAIYYHSAVVNNGYVYKIGGHDGNNATSSVLFAPINATGSIGAWTPTTNLPKATYRHASVVNNGYIYEMGGIDIANFQGTTTVYFAPINATGSIGSWTSTTALPVANYSFNSVVWNGYVYSVGGTTSTVFFAPINSTGSLGSWTATTPGSVSPSAGAAVVNNGYLYQIGGAFTTNVGFAPINSTGSIGTWISTTPLPSALENHTSIVNNGYVYVLGGDTSTNPTSTVYYAPINTTGSLGSWITSTPLPRAIREYPSIVNNGYIYTFGGNTSSTDSTTGTSTVFYAPFACTGDAITDNTVLVNSAVFTRLQNTNTVLNKTVVSVQADLVVSYNGTAPEGQYSEEKITTTALRN